MIGVTDLTVRVPGFSIERASFAVSAGGVGVITGPTGSGKTTLVECIAGIRRVASGSVVLDGVDVSARTPEQRNVSLVYQAAWLFPHLTVRENVAYGARRTAAVGEMIERLEVVSLLGKPLATLSGGERQQVALARALSREPRTLLLDEPFAAMDGALRQRIRASVLQWAREFGATTLLVTHDAVEAALDGSAQIRLDRGQVRVDA